jgi:hypothetical protein
MTTAATAGTTTATTGDAMIATPGEETTDSQTCAATTDGAMTFGGATTGILNENRGTGRTTSVMTAIPIAATTAARPLLPLWLLPAR